MKKSGKMLVAILGILAATSCGGKSMSETAESETTVNTEETGTSVAGDNTAWKNKLATLGGNIDYMPDGAGLFQYETQKTKLTFYDYTTPGDYYYGEETEFYWAYQSTWDMVDAFKADCLDVRDKALSGIRELDQFIEIDGCRGLLHYDNVADEISIHFVSDAGYYEITSGYTAEGKIKISAILYRWPLIESDTTHQSNYYEILEYVEDEKSIYLNTNDSYQNWDGYGFGRTKRELLIESDSVTNEIVQLERYTEDYGDYHRDFTDVCLQEKENGVRAVVEYMDENDQFDVSAYDEDGHVLTKYVAASERSMDVSLYSLYGWDSATSDTAYDISLDVTIGDETYSEGEYYGDYYIQFYKNNLIGDGFIPLVSIADPVNLDLNYDRAMEMLKDNFGLTPKKDVSKEIGTILNNYSDYAKTKTVFGITDVTTIDSALFQSIYDRYDIHTLDYDGIEAMMTVDAIPLDFQKETFPDMGYLTALSSGDAKCDAENLKINLKDMKLTIPASALLSDTMDYQAALVLCGDDTEVLALGKISRFDGTNDLVLEFNDEEINLIAAFFNHNEGDYVLKLVAGTTRNGEFSRLSSGILLGVPDSFTGTHVLSEVTEDFTDEVSGDETKITTVRELSITSGEKTVLSIIITSVEETIVSEKTEEEETLIPEEEEETFIPEEDEEENGEE